MEKKIQAKANDYVDNFKNSLIETFAKCSLEESDKVVLENFLNDYPTLNFDKTDFQRRKRVKNFVPMYERCIAKRANGERCTRRRKDEMEFCGTHSKGQPHGVISESDTTKPIKKITVRTEDIKGIIYYIDDHFNVYDSKDILNNTTNPKIIAKYTIDKDGNISIPEFGI